MQRCDSGIFFEQIDKMCRVFNPTAALTSRMVRVVVRSSVRAAFRPDPVQILIGRNTDAV